jgi:hypothetical protein
MTVADSIHSDCLHSGLSLFWSELRLTSLLTCLLRIRTESYVTTDGQSASLSWNNAPIWGLRPDFFLLLSRSCGFADVGAVSDDTTGLSFTIADGPRHRSHSRVRVQWDSWPYFTVSDSRLSFSSFTEGLIICHISFQTTCIKFPSFLPWTASVV